MSAAAPSSFSSNPSGEYSFCVICLTDVTPGASLPEEQSIETRCRHVFHQFCLNQWLASALSEGKCPSCRQIAFPEPLIENVAPQVAAYAYPARHYDQPIYQERIAGGMGPPPDPFKELKKYQFPVENNSLKDALEKLRTEIASEFLNKRANLSFDFTAYKFIPTDFTKTQLFLPNICDLIQPVQLDLSPLQADINVALLIQDLPPLVQSKPPGCLKRILSYLPCFNRK